MVAFGFVVKLATGLGKDERGTITAGGAVAMDRPPLFLSGTLLALAAVWKACAPLADAAPVLIANVGEEGEGNLCGMRYLCRGAQGSRYRAFLVLDGPNAEHVTCRALASRRFEVTVTGAGGHSWNDHGLGNPVHTISRAITWFTEQAQELEQQGGGPRSSFNFASNKIRSRCC